MFPLFRGTIKRELFKGEYSVQNDSLLDNKDFNKLAKEITEPSMFKGIIDIMDYGVAISDLNGNIIYVNNYFANMHGYSPKELIGKNISIFHTEEQMDAVDQIINELKEIGSFRTYRVWHRHKDGRIFPTIMSGLVIKDDKGRPKFLVGMAIDITQRRKLREKLRKVQSELEIRNKIANAFLTSEEDELYESVISIICKALQSENGMLGYIDEDGNIICQSFPKYTTVDNKFGGGNSHSKSDSLWNEAVTKKKTIIINEKLNTHDSHIEINRIIIVPIIYKENAIGIIALANKPENYGDQDKQLIESLANYIAPILNAKMQRDKQELARRKAESDLIEKEELYRSAIETAGAVPYCRNFETNSYEFIGDGIKDLTGYSKEEFTPDLWESIIIEENLYGRYAGLSLEDARKKAEEENETTWWLDLRIKARDGKEKWLLDTSVQIRGKKGKLLKTLGIIQDITNRKLTEERLKESNRLLEETLSELRRTQQQIIQQERLRALGQLASGIAHDFNNSLMPIMGYSDLLLTVPDMLKDYEKAKKYLELIRTSSEDAKEVVDRLRSFYRSSSGNEVFTRVDLNNLINQVVNLTKPKWKDQALSNGVTIKVLTDLDDIPFISGIESELREAITNLILNSVDAIELNGTITLRTRSDGEKVILSIIDDGHGMSEDVLMRCFDPFFTTKGENGTGLGLSIVYGVVQRHKGTIEVKSSLGEGTTFTISFPALKIDTKEEKDQEANISLKPLHILVVDDEPIIQEIIGNFLEKDGHTYEFANDGREGLIKFKSNNFDLVITDKAMPDVSGDQLSSFLKEISPKTPIIMITGFGSIMNSAGEIPETVDCLLSKPLKFQDFKNAIFDVMKRYSRDSAIY